MRILIDLRCCQTPPPRGGVAVYAEEITRAALRAAANCQLPAARSVESVLFANGIGDVRAHLPAFDPMFDDVTQKTTTVVFCAPPLVRWIVTHWPNKLWNAAAYMNRGARLVPPADVVFLPNLNFLPPLRPSTRLVVTVHDLSFEHFPDCFTWKQRLWHRAVRPRALLARADAIVAVSHTTKRGLVETYGVPEEKITVISPGIHSAVSVTPSEHSTFHIPHSTFPYLLALAEQTPRKNFDGVLAAFERLARERSDLHLMVVGIHGSASNRIRAMINRSPAHERIRLLGAISETKKRALYTHAACFVYPSLWEGFGFPPLEAMAVGCPVVASTGGSLPEVLGDAALLVDPLDPAAIARAIARVLDDAALRTSLIVRGRARAAEFSWNRAGQQLLEVLVRQSEVKSHRNGTQFLS